MRFGYASKPENASTANPNACCALSQKLKAVGTCATGMSDKHSVTNTSSQNDTRQNKLIVIAMDAHAFFLVLLQRFFKFSQFSANGRKFFHLGAVVSPIEHGTFQVFFEVSEC